MSTLERIAAATTSEVMHMINDREHEENQLENEEMVAACKKVINDEDFMDTLRIEQPMDYISLGLTVGYMRSCGENI